MSNLALCVKNNVAFVLNSPSSPCPPTLLLLLLLQEGGDHLGRLARSIGVEVTVVVSWYYLVLQVALRLHDLNSLGHTVCEWPPFLGCDKQGRGGDRAYGSPPCPTSARLLPDFCPILICPLLRRGTT